MVRGTVFNIQRYSIHDGPGVRTAVFLKGCPLRCPWCHNPEGIHPEREILFRETRCNLCGDCLGACRADALALVGDAIVVDDERCDRCGRCEEACPAGALEVAGEEMAVEQVVAEIEKDVVFYDQSGGGVTFSGGEPLLQPAFLAELLRACREREIHTAVDTSGYASPEALRGIAPLADLFLFDLKLMDEGRHRVATGVSNGPILRNLRQLIQDGHDVIVRVPIIPTINDDEENLLGIGASLRSLSGVQRVDLLPYHGIAAEKYRRLRKEYVLSHLQPPSRERLAHLAGLLDGLGLDVTAGG